MAELLKRQFGLSTLKISLHESGPESTVRIELQSLESGKPEARWQTTIAPAELGIPSRFEGRMERAGKYEFRLPDRIGEELARTFVEEALPAPVWVHLVQPYGFLNAVPWERLVSQFVQVPVLRLPDFVFSPPDRVGSRLDVAICASVPRAKARFNAEDYVSHIVKAYSQIPDHALTIHLFTDLDVYPFCERLKEETVFEGTEIRAYDPRGSDSPQSSDSDDLYPGTLTGSKLLKSPWLRWMDGSVKKTGFDVVHFACHGFLSTNKGFLALAESPTFNEDRRSARFVGPAELNTFLNRVGAWATGFTSPENGYSPIGLRLLADSLVRTRPGPMLLQAGIEDNDWEHLSGLAGFLYSGTRSTPPMAPEFFVSCQPSLVRQNADEEEEAGTEEGISRDFDIPGRSPNLGFRLEEVFESKASETPGWLSATARYIEQRRGQVEAAFKQASYQPLSKSRRAELEAAEEALQKLELMIHKKISGDPHRGEGEGGEESR